MAGVLRAVQIAVATGVLLAVAGAAAVGVAALDERFTARRFDAQSLHQCPLAVWRDQAWPDCPPAAYGSDGS